MVCFDKSNMNGGPWQLENKVTKLWQRFAVWLPPGYLYHLCRWMQQLQHCSCQQERSRVSLVGCLLLISLLISAVTMQSLHLTVFMTVDGAIKSTINTYINNSKHTEMDYIKQFMFSTYSSCQGISGHSIHILK